MQSARYIWIVLAVWAAVLLPPQGVGAVYPDIDVNGSDGPVTVLPVNAVTVTVALAGCACEFVPADWWVLAETPWGPAAARGGTRSDAATLVFEQDDLLRIKLLYDGE